MEQHGRGGKEDVQGRGGGEKKNLEEMEKFKKGKEEGGHRDV